MKLDVNVLRYMSKEDFRVLTAVEMGQKNVSGEGGVRSFFCAGVGSARPAMLRVSNSDGTVSILLQTCACLCSTRLCPPPSLTASLASSEHPEFEHVAKTAVFAANSSACCAHSGSDSLALHTP